MNPIIAVENLGKQYRIGALQAPYATVRESLVEAAKAPLRRLTQGIAAAELVWALRHVSFEVQPGEVVGIVGRNGAGKSTLLKLLSRITEPTEGRIELRGHVASLLEVGTGFHPELTGRENIFLNGAILGMPRRQILRKFDDIVAFAEVDKFIDTPVKRYSSGMYLRLAFAVAAHLEPDILVVDEVLAVGDAAFQNKCLGKMQQVGREGRTVLFVSHHMAAVQQLCSRALLMQQGTLAMEGPTEKVISAYLSDAIATQDGDFDLAVHAARGSQYQPLIRRLVLRRTQSDNPTTNFYPDDAMIADIEVEAATLLREPRLALAIEDSFGRRITTVATYFQDKSFADLDGPARFRCTIPRLALGSGRYLISLSVHDKYTMLDALPNVGWFEVGWSNNYGNGEPYLAVYGPVLTEATWTRVD